MDGDKEIFHDEICEMAAEQEEAEMSDFYGGPQDSHEALLLVEADYLEKIAVSYPHDLTWAQAIVSLAGLRGAAA